MRDTLGISPAVMDQIHALPDIRPAAVARGRARAGSAERCPAYAVAAALVATLPRRPAC